MSFYQQLLTISIISLLFILLITQNLIFSKLEISKIVGWQNQIQNSFLTNVYKTLVNQNNMITNEQSIALKLDLRKINKQVISKLICLKVNQYLIQKGKDVRSHQQIIKEVNCNLDKIQVTFKQLDQLGGQINQTKDIKIQNQPILSNNSQFDFDEDDYLDIEIDQEGIEGGNQNNLENLKQLINDYVKSGKALIRSIRKYAEASNQEERSDIYGSQMASQEHEQIFSLIKTQDRIENLLQQQQTTFSKNGSNKGKQIAQTENNKAKKMYNFLPDREISHNFDRKPARYKEQDDQSKKKYNILTAQQIQDLRHDLKTGLFTKSMLLKKYGISQSTLVRFVHRFNKMPENITWSKKRGKVENYQLQKVQTTRKDIQPIQPQRKMPIRKFDRFGRQQQQMKQEHNEFDTQIMTKKSTNRYVQGNSPSNLLFRSMFMKQLKKLDMNKIVFVDQLRFFKLTSEINDQSTFRHPVYGNVKQANFAIAINNFQIVHWKMNHTKLSSDNFINFMNDIIQKAQGYTFVMDNHKIHKSEEFKNKIRQEDIKVLYLPPCSEQLNPIFFFYEEFCKRLLQRLGNKCSQKQIFQNACRLLMDYNKQGYHSGYFSKCEQYWEMAEKNQMFPLI